MAFGTRCIFWLISQMRPKQKLPPCIKEPVEIVQHHQRILNASWTTGTDFTRHCQAYCRYSTPSWLNYTHTPPFNGCTTVYGNCSRICGRPSHSSILHYLQLFFKPPCSSFRTYYHCLHGAATDSGLQLQNPTPVNFCYGNRSGAAQIAFQHTGSQHSRTRQHAWRCNDSALQTQQK